MKARFINLRILMLSGLFFCSIITMSQERELPLNIQSPNSASLGTFGNAPVNYYTGSPNITIPIHSLNAYGLSMDIYLSYAASGIQIDRHPGWVGQNWNLQAGGVITRTVQCRADEFVNSESGGNWLHSHFLSIQAYDTQNPLNKAGAKQLALDKAFNYHLLDLEPDIYSFNFMGISGKFFYDKDGKWKVLSESNIEVIFDPFDANNYSYPEVAPESIPYRSLSNKYNKTISGFKLRDENGTIYEFGCKENSIEYSLPFFEQLFDTSINAYPPHWTANSWYLTKVTDKHGNELFDLDYTRGYWVAEFYRAYYDKETFGHTPLGGLFGDIDCSNGIMVPDYVDGSLISPVYLSKISSLHGESVTFKKSLSDELSYDFSKLSYKHGQLVNNYAGKGINFYYYTQADNVFASPTGLTGVSNPIASLGWCKLDEISINTDKRIKYVFNYNNNPNERLFLDKIDIECTEVYSSSAIDKYTAYRFGYNQPKLLPEYFSKKVDHWGYYKGTEYVIDKTDYSKHYSTRNPAEKYLQIGMLNSVSYPTGGYSTYKYEPHDYSRYVSNDRQSLHTSSGIAGGLRVKEINDYDGVTAINRKFKYQKSKSNTQSSGILNTKPQYYWEDWKTETDDGGYYHEKVFSINSVVPLSNSFESHIGYSDVQEYKSDGSYIHYSFVDQSDVKDQAASVSFNGSDSPYEPLNELGYARSKIESVKYYDSNSSIVKEVINSYRPINETTEDYVISHKVKFGYKCNKQDHKYYGGNVIKLFYNDYDLTSTTIIDYLDGEQLTSVVDYQRSDYDGPNCNYRFLNKLTETKGSEVTETLFKYPHDAVGQPYMNEMISAGRLADVVETRNLRNQKLLEITKVEYKKENNLLLKESVKHFDSDERLTNQVLYKTYDVNGNLVEYQGMDGVNTVFVYGYKKRYPIAVIKNVDYSKVKSYINSNQSTFDNLYQEEAAFNEKMNTLRAIASTSLLTSYMYKPGVGITCITDPNKRSEKYSYDDFNRLNRVFDHNGMIVKDVQYNYAPYPMLSLHDIWSFSNTYQQGTSVDFYTTPIGGSGDFTYRWSIGDEVKITNTPSVTITPGAYGDVSLQCKITDNKTGKVYTKYKYLFIKQSQLYMDNIRVVGSNSTWSKKSFDIKSPLNDEITLFLLSQCSNGATFKIGNQVINIPGMGAKTITVSTSGGQRLSCEIEIIGLRGAFAQFSITNNQNSQVEIGSPNLISVSL